MNYERCLDSVDMLMTARIQYPEIETDIYYSPDGQDVKNVLSWVETGEVDCGVVYATDAYASGDVKVICEAPEGSVRKVVYPAGVTAGSRCSI